MREINLIVVHCLATGADDDVGVEEVRRWHKARGFDDVGYHYIIRRNGDEEIGRPEEVIGAHAIGHNSKSIGVALAGGVDANDGTRARFNYTRAQMARLEKRLTDLTLRYPLAKVEGHGDLPNVQKACPVFDVRAWWYGNTTGAIA